MWGASLSARRSWFSAGHSVLTEWRRRGWIALCCMVIVVDRIIYWNINSRFNDKLQLQRKWCECEQVECVVYYHLYIFINILDVAEIVILGWYLLSLFSYYNTVVRVWNLTLVPTVRWIYLRFQIFIIAILFRLQIVWIYTTTHMVKEAGSSNCSFWRSQSIPLSR